jgi:acetylornithine deacetylase/succinyl-diaminopimelate desuccinylase-like protein
MFAPLPVVVGTSAPLHVAAAESHRPTAAGISAPPGLAAAASLRLAAVAPFALALIAAAPAGALSAQEVDFAALQDEAVTRTQEYLRVNTVNPPGNESRAVEFFARIFEAEGIAWDSAESAPGRGNIWARIEGGDQPALILLHHSDVVPADEEFWDTDPMAAEIRDEMIVGRGALDTKTLGILHLQAFLALHRSGIRPDRDVIFMATADEEAGGFFGAGWLVENRPELFENVGAVLNEGGGGSAEEDGTVQYGIEVTQKVPHWLRLVANGEPGHGSIPRVASSVGRLIRALERLREHGFPPRVVPAVATYLDGMAAGAPARWQDRLRDLDGLVRDPDALLELQLWNPAYHALLRNTCSITMLEGSDKINVVPPSATAQIDCRMLPDQDPDAFVEELRTVLNDPMVEIEPVMVFSPAVSSTDTPLYRTLVEVSQEHEPGAAVIPSVSTGFTDSHFFRDLGIDAYGYSPMVVPRQDAGGLHGNNERISIENVRRGTRMMTEILLRVVGGRPLG